MANPARIVVNADYGDGFQVELYSHWGGPGALAATLDAGISIGMLNRLREPAYFTRILSRRLFAKLNKETGGGIYPAKQRRVGDCTTVEFFLPDTVRFDDFDYEITQNNLDHIIQELDRLSDCE